MPQVSSQYLEDIETYLCSTRLDRPNAFRTFSCTHIGLVRENNEDSFHVNEKQNLWLIADGMGGYSGGGRASAVVVDDVRSFTKRETLSESILDLETRFLLSNKACRAMCENKVVGSTVAVLFIYQSMAVCLWAGDSRVYRWRNGELSLITEDHTLIQERCRRGEVSLDEAQKLPSSNILTRAIGIHQNLRLEMEHTKIKPGDRYLISSDGLYREFEFREIQKFVSGSRVDSIIETMVGEAMHRGGRDNITIILVQVL